MPSAFARPWVYFWYHTPSYKAVSLMLQTEKGPSVLWQARERCIAVIYVNATDAYCKKIDSHLWHIMDRQRWKAHLHSPWTEIWNPVLEGKLIQLQWLWFPSCLQPNNTLGDQSFTCLLGQESIDSVNILINLQRPRFDNILICLWPWADLGSTFNARLIRTTPHPARSPLPKGPSVLRLPRER